MHDLHIHLGGAVPSSVLWEILCDNGLRTEFTDFTTFHDSLTARPDEVEAARQALDITDLQHPMTDEVEADTLRFGTTTVALAIARPPAGR